MTSSPSVLQQITKSSRGAKTGVWLMGMGALHFAAPKPFDTIVPAELPGSPRAYTYGSGVAATAVGGPVGAPPPRRIGALAAIALYLGVLPANVNMVRLWKDKPLPMRAAAVARLPMQIPMITQAWKIYKAS